MPRKKRKPRAKKHPKPTPQQLRETFNREENERKMWENTASGAFNAIFGIGKALHTKLTAKPEPKPEPPKPKTGRELLPPFLRE
jgi:hypothetical protein